MTLSRQRALIIGVSALLVIGGCGEASPPTTTDPAAAALENFMSMLDSNATCGRLSNVADDIPEGTNERVAAEDKLAEIGCGDSGSQRTDVTQATAPPTAAKPEYETLCPGSPKLVTYFVEGTASGVDITISNQQGNTEQASNRAVPLSASGKPGLRVGCVGSGFFYYISAQNKGDSGTAFC